MLFGTYNYIMQQVAWYQFSRNESLRRYRAPRVDSAPGRCMSHRTKQHYCGVKMLPSLSRTCAEPGFKSGGLCHLGHCWYRIIPLVALCSLYVPKALNFTHADCRALDDLMILKIKNHDLNQILVTWTDLKSFKYLRFDFDI